MSVLELQFLGGIKIHLDGSPLTTLKTVKGKALLCYLAVTGTEHSRSKLSGLLWTDLSEKNARLNLRKTLSRLKPHLSTHLIITRETISFNKGKSYLLDVADFEAGATSELDVHRLQESVKFYEGDFLAGFDLPNAALFNEWMQVQRTRLRKLALDAFQILAGYFKAHKEYDLGISYARRLLTIEPWHEEMHRSLMYMLASSGRRSAALKQYEECRKILVEELGVEPSSPTMELLEKIRKDELDPEPDAPGGIDSNSSPLISHVRETPIRNLPILSNPIIGRQRELQELIGRMTNPDVRLVTITGIGGIGKTQLALTAAHHLTATKGFRDGVFFAPLSSVATQSRLVTTIGECLGLALAGTRKPDAVIFDYLRDKAALMVLDSFEQLLPEIDFVVRLLQAAPRCKLLITSRERLKMREEWVLDLEGLMYPETIQEAQNSEYDAIILFSERAKQTRANFSLENEIQGVIQICQLTQGLPLALEQAASLVRVSSATEIADQIEERLDALATSLRNLPERHRSMRAVFDETWHWLSEEEQWLFCQLSVFQGGFTREAAEQVAGANLDSLASLVDKSLIRMDTDYRETTRYNLHDLVWQYASEKLIELGQIPLKRVHRAHLDFFISLTERARHFWHTEKEWEWHERLEPERGNLYAALRWAVEQKEVEYALRLNASLLSFLLHDSPAGEAIDWLESSLSLEWDKGSRSMMWARAEALRLTGYAVIWTSNLKLAQMHFQEAAKLYAKVEDQLNKAWCLRGSGLVCLIQGDLVGAQNFMQESWDISQEIHREQSLAWSAYGLGIVALATVKLKKAEALLEAAITHFREHGMELGIFHTLISLGHLRRSQGDMVKAEACYKEALAIRSRTRYIHYVAEILEGIAHIAVSNDNPDVAVQLFGAAQSRRDSIEMKRWAHHEIECHKSLEITKVQLPVSTWEKHWEQGYRMPLAHALEFAMTV